MGESNIKTVDLLSRGRGGEGAPDLTCVAACIGYAGKGGRYPIQSGRSGSVFFSFFFFLNLKNLSFLNVGALARRETLGTNKNTYQGATVFVLFFCPTSAARRLEKRRVDGRVDESR